MATATLAERIQDDLTLLVANQALIDLSNQQDTDATQDTARTLRVCQMAAAKIESILGSVGSYDDTDGTIGDQAALDLGIRLAVLYYSQVFTFVLKDAGRDYIGMVLEEAAALAATRIQENATPVIKHRDNDDLNARHSGPDWPDDNDTTGQG